MLLLQLFWQLGYVIWYISWVQYSAWASRVIEQVGQFLFNQHAICFGGVQRLKWVLEIIMAQFFTKLPVVDLITKQPNSWSWLSALWILNGCAWKEEKTKKNFCNYAWPIRLQYWIGSLKFCIWITLLPQSSCSLSMKILILSISFTPCCFCKLDMASGIILAKVSRLRNEGMERKFSRHCKAEVCHRGGRKEEEESWKHFLCPALHKLGIG